MVVLKITRNELGRAEIMVWSWEILLRQFQDDYSVEPCWRRPKKCRYCAYFLLWTFRVLTTIYEDPEANTCMRSWTRNSPRVKIAHMSKNRKFSKIYVSLVGICLRVLSVGYAPWETRRSKRPHKAPWGLSATSWTVALLWMAGAVNLHSHPGPETCY